MLKLNHLSISFHNKNIFDNTDFIAADGKMTVIIGGSGKGKSTLLKTLLFEHKCDYYYNDKYLTGLNSDEKRVFIFQKISYIDQIPQFINDFTIGQHIELIKKIYSVIDDRKDYLKKLGIEDLLEKYPKQLSGGQKTRVAIFLGLIKEPEILILDEPTSSLDKDNILKVIEILTDYCQLGHTVIVSSHDNQLIKQCDVVYEIFNQRLNIINKNIESIIKYNDKKNLIFKKDGYYKYWKLLDSRHKYYNIVMTFLLSTTILITIFSNNFSNGANSSYKNQLNSLSSREMIVYKECVEGAGYSFNEDEFSFSKDEVNKIKQINHIKNIEGQYNIILNTDTMSAYNTGENIERSENLMDVTLYEGDDIIESKNLNDCSVHFRTFKQSIDKKNLKYEFSDEGIIISNELYKKIFNNENLTHPYLEFIILIPQYNATNIAEYHLGDDVESQFTVPINTILGEYKKVKLPIAAVVNDDALINGVPIPEYAIYMNKVQLESYIKDSYSQEGRILYEVETNDGEYLLFYNDIPKNISIKKVSSTITESPWQPNSYVIEVDDLTNLNQVAKEISDLGYGVEGEYVDSTPFDLLSKQNQNVLTLSIASIFILLYVFYIYLKYLTMSNELGLRNFLEKLGLKDSEIKVLNTQRYMYKVLKLFLLTSVMFVAIIEFCVYNQIIFFIMKPEIKLFIYILFVAIIIEFIIPKFLEKISAFKQKK